MRQALNKCRIEGYLSEINLKYGSFEKNGATVENVGGSIKVLVQQVINGQSANIEVPVHMFATKFTNAGKPNPAYASIEKIMNEFVSIAAAGGIEHADKVRITKGEIRMNEFPGQTGQIVSQPRVHASFVSKVIGEFEPQATFELEFMVASMRAACDSTGVELDPRKIEVSVAVPQYGDSVDMMTLVTSNPNVVSAVESYWEPGNCYKANGRLNFSSVTETVEEQVGFGEAMRKTRTTNVNELVITGGSDVPMDEEFAWTQEEIKAGNAKRKANLEAKQNRGVAKKAPATKSGFGALDLGF